MPADRAGGGDGLNRVGSEEDVRREGKSFFPYALYHDALMSLLVVVMIIVPLTAMP